MHIGQKVIQPVFRRQTNLLALVRTKQTKSCEERDCCGNLIDDCVVPDVVVERECHLASFYTWKPKVPDLKCAPPGKAKPPKRAYSKTKCYPGMRTQPEDFKKKAADCSKQCIHIPPICPPKGIKLVPPHPPSKMKCLPKADWDIDGHMD